MSCFNIENLSKGSDVRNGLNCMFAEQYECMKMCNKSVSTIEARNSIPEYFRCIGMEVYVCEDCKKYRLMNGISNDNWVCSTPARQILTLLQEKDMTITTTPQILNGSLINIFSSNFEYNDGISKYIGYKNNINLEFEAFFLMQSQTKDFSINFVLYVNDQNIGEMPIFVEKNTGITRSIYHVMQNINSNDEIKVCIYLDSEPNRAVKVNGLSKKIQEIII